MEPSQNQLIAGLGPRARRNLLAIGEEVPLAMAQVLGGAGRPIAHVYFPVAGFISLVAATHGSSGIEIGMVGTEGMLGAFLALGVSTHPVGAVVQAAGSAWRIDAPAFRAELTINAPLSRAVCRYLYVLICQQATSSICLRFHLIAPRLARWLLMRQDRAHSSSFHITHEVLATVMGVRRVGITNAATLLHSLGLIAYRRGEMQIIDRGGLEAIACGCYRADRKSYADILA